MSLAVSYTNESLRHHACDALYRWLMHSPRYAHLIPDSSAINSSLMYVISDMFISIKCPCHA